MANDLASSAPLDGNGQPFMGAVDLTNGVMHALEGGTLSTIPNSPSGAKSIRLRVESLDGGQVTIGTTTDTAWIGSGAGSTIALLKALYALISTSNADLTTINTSISTTNTDLTIINTTLGTTNTNTSNAATVLGTTADAAYAGSGNATLDALLKGIYSLLSTGNTNTAHTNAAGSNTALTSPPANTSAAADTALTFSSTVNHWSLQNNSSQTIYYALDASTTAVVSPTTPIYVLAPNAQVWWDYPVTVLHVYTTTAIAVNGAVASTGLVLSGRA